MRPVFGCKPEEDLAGDLTELRQRMSEIHQEVWSHIQIASGRLKKRYEIKSKEDHYAAEDLVWLYNPQKRQGL